MKYNFRLLSDDFEFLFADALTLMGKRSRILYGRERKWSNYAAIGMIVAGGERRRILEGEEVSSFVWGATVK